MIPPRSGVKKTAVSSRRMWTHSRRGHGPRFCPRGPSARSVVGAGLDATFLPGRRPARGGALRSRPCCPERDGHFVPQVVDLYLVCQYARAMRRAIPSSTTRRAAERVRRAALYPTGWPWGTPRALRAAMARRARDRHRRGSLPGGDRARGRSGRRLGGEREGRTAGAWSRGRAGGWGLLYGSDIALFMFLCLWLLERMFRGVDDGRGRGAVVAASLVASRSGRPADAGASGSRGRSAGAAAHGSWCGCRRGWASPCGR